MAGFRHQLRYLIYRNLLLKRRNKKQLYQELLFPLLFVILIGFMGSNLNTERYDPLGYGAFHSYKLLQPNGNDSFLPDASKAWAFTPNTTQTWPVMLAVNASFGSDAPPEFLAFDNEEDMVTAYNNSYQDLFTIGIVFSGEYPTDLTVAIRMPKFDVPDTDADSRFIASSRCRSRNEKNPGLARCGTNRYLFTGFAALQTVLQNAIHSQLASGPLDLPDFSVRMLPVGASTSSSGDDPMRIIIVIFFVLLYGIFVAVLLTNLVYEKEKKIKETMLMMGMSNAAFWLAWFIIYIVILFVLSLVVTVLFGPLIGTFRKSNFGVIFLTLFFYGMSLVSFSFMLTPFFSRSLVAGAAATVVVLILGLIYIPFGLFEITTVVKWLVSFFSPVAFALAMDQALSLEEIQVGVQFNNLIVDGFPPYMVMLLIDTVLYLLLAVYFDNVIPGNYGQNKVPWFCFMPSYWRKSSMGNLVDSLSDLETMQLNGQDDVEQVSAVLRAKAGVRIRNLSKTYKGNGQNNPDILAVRGMSLDIYEGQITCLLGHNGAGKTTLINTLTGLITADSGQATICGYSIRDPIQMQKIRSMMGVCSQDNTLFDVLSPREHLKVYAGLKGVPSQEIDMQVDKILKLTMLDESADTKSKDLSGGQKRKLCVGIALIGDPKILFLDEPSSGMDPYSRRQLWNLLKSQRQGRIMVLTTHFMDEADILADRKAMMSLGRLRCYGSSLFLKNRFGIGYHLGMVVKKSAHIDKITELVTTHVPESVVSRSHGMELAYTLPIQDANKFPDLFQALESDAGMQGGTVAKQLGIKSYGVSMTSLEEVFLNISDEENEENEPIEEADIVQTSDIAPINPGRSRNYKSMGDQSMALNVEHLITKPLQPGKYQIRALCKLEFLQMLRNPRTYIFRLLFPIVLLVACAIVTGVVQPDDGINKDQPELALDPTLYLKTTASSPLSGLTKLLYQNNLTSGQDIELLKKEFERMKLISDEITDMSLVNSKAPRSMATVANDLGTTGNAPAFLALYNSTAQHSIPVILGLLNNAIARLQAPGKDLKDVIIASKPFPRQIFGATINYTFLLVLLVALSVSLLPIGFITEVVKLRQEKIRTQLRVSGVKMTHYWASHLLIDGSQLYLIAAVGIVVNLATGFAVGGSAFTTAGAIVCLIVFIIFYIPLEVLFCYCLSFLFREFKTTQSMAQFFYIFLPVILMTIVLIFDATNSQAVAMIMHYVMCVLWPPYIIFGEMYYFNQIYDGAKFNKQLDQLTFGYYLDFNQKILPTIICVVGELVLFTFLLYVLEIRSTGGSLLEEWKCRKRQGGAFNRDIIENEDPDVKEEREKVQAIFDQGLNTEKCVVAASGIRKEFDRSKGCCRKQHSNKLAVRNLSLSVNEGEVFGLLGPNGAGKTTSMNVIAADTEATKGQVQIAGYDITSSLSEAFQVMGYCPQHDPLYSHVTMQEHLEAYGLIKGIHPTDVKTVAQHFMDALNITQHASKKPSELSGGTKRKLCFAISMLGKPKIVFLDEPSTGMDPTSKRFVWNTIIASFRDDRGAVLTTHYMEEADAVCSRVGIMISGRLMCLGTTQHLKGKYGGGYLLEAKLNPGEAYYSMDHTTGEATRLLEQKMQALDDKIHHVFPSAETVENFGERVTYKIPKEDVGSLARVFAALEEGKETLNIEEYSFSQATLEQVFIEFAKMQRDDDQPYQRHHQVAWNNADPHVVVA
ncbi:ATP-binding cassette sub-family A member 5-like [Patiria miniata]|uniref:ABC transporter domain-containing protein n=1 Tax=Patiria miniata TaxID=46514 RepID=A0A914AR36_PATMI|nr:ATP-binding cassette sub-family A member 5-like [Patiria miniata]